MSKASPPYSGPGEPPVQFVPSFGSERKYIIGDKTLDEPLVTTTQLRGHLALLDVFNRLKEEIDNIPPPYARSERPDGHDPLETQWNLFVSLATERFERWVVGIRDVVIPDALTLLPPLDVLMVWYTYILNPCWFREDATRLPEVAKLKQISIAFEELLNNPEVPYLLLQPPAEEREKFWHERTLVPFSYISSFHTLNTRTIMCPICRAPVDVVLHNAQGTGYLQKGFKAQCSNSEGHIKAGSTEISKGRLRVRKFAETVASSGTSSQTALSGTVFYPRGRPDDDLKKRGEKLKKTIASTARTHLSAASRKRKPTSNPDAVYTVDEDLCQAVIEEMQYRIDSIKRFDDPSRLVRIADAYHEDKTFSVDLASAVLRQWSFVQALNRLGWTDPGRFTETDEGSLTDVLSRYHAFLHLKALYPEEELTPTIDIDFVWHTHILFSDKYYADSIAFLRQIFDHEDTVEAADLSRRFGFTARAWQEHYGAPYTSCGCPEPPTNLVQKGASLLTQLSRKASQAAKSPLIFVPKASSLQEKAATHPSNHNGVHFWHPQDTDAFATSLDSYKTLAKQWRNSAEKHSKNHNSATGFAEGEHVFPFAIKLPLRTNYTTDRLQADQILVDRYTPLTKPGGNKPRREDLATWDQMIVFDPTD